VTTRQHVQETHSGKSECRSCHNLIDGVGFTFENYDALGRYVTKEHGVTIDATGEVPLTAGAEVVDDAMDLAKIVETSYQIKQCVVDHLYRYAYGHAPKDRAGQCEISATADVWVKSGGDPQAILQAMVIDDSFRFMKLPTEAP
jgi:hypothetical protein